MSFRPMRRSFSLLRIYVGEFDKYQHHTLYELIVQQAREAGLAGCTVLRGHWGYGSRGVVHTDVALEGAGERPILIEIADSQDRLRDFAKRASAWLKKAGGLITEESILVHHYQHAQAVPANALAGSKEIKANSQEETMSQRSLSGENTLLRVYIGETDKFENKPLFEAIVLRCKDSGIAGCTVIQGVMGFGASSILHKGHAFRISQDLPMVIEIVDSQERIQRLLAQIQPMLQGALVTEEKIRVHHHASAE